MSARKTREREYWWSSDRSEKYWIELLKTDMQGDRLFAPDTRTYRTMEAVNVGDLVLHWHSERYPGIKGRTSGIYSVSRAIGRIRPSHDLWEGKISVEVPLSRKVPLREPILLPDLKEISDELNRNRVSGRHQASPSLLSVAIPGYRAQAYDPVPHEAHRRGRRADRRRSPPPGDRHEPGLTRAAAVAARFRETSCASSPQCPAEGVTAARLGGPSPGCVGSRRDR